MAVKLDLGTPDTDPPDSNNPDGRYLDEGPGIPGTPVLEKNKNSFYYFFSRMMDAGSLLFNGLVDNFTLSQFFDAFLNVINGGSAVDKWDDTEAAAYEAAGYLVQDVAGKHYTSTGKALNLNKDPANPANADYWYPSDGADLLEVQAKRGLPVESGMHNITNFAHAQYAQNILVDKVKKGAVTYDLFQVIPDGTVLTGDADLEAIFDPGGANEYPFIDLYAPDVLGTRTLIDMRGRNTTSMTAGGGEFPTLAEVKEDQGQGWQLGADEDAAGARDYWVSAGARDFTVSVQADVNSAQIFAKTVNQGVAPFKAMNNGIDGDIRQGKTTHGKLVVTGIHSIKVMIPV